MNIFNDRCPMCNGQIIPENDADKNSFYFKCEFGDHIHHSYSLIIHKEDSSISELIEFKPYALDTFYYPDKVPEIISVLWKWSDSSRDSKDILGWKEIGEFPYIEPSEPQHMKAKVDKLLTFL